jgi:hypothetical protein
MRCPDPRNRRPTCGYARSAIPHISRDRPPAVAPGDLQLHIPAWRDQTRSGRSRSTGAVLAGWRRVWDSNPR